LSANIKVTIRLFLQLKFKNLITSTLRKLLVRSVSVTATFVATLVFNALIFGKQGFAQSLDQTKTNQANASQIPATTLSGGLVQQALPATINDTEPPLRLTEVTATDLDFFDQSRNRKIPVRVYAPAILSDSSPGRATPLPLIVFSHGLGGSRNGYSYIGRYLAARGYIVLHTQHEGSDRSIWSANIFSLYSNMQSATRETHAIDRVLDVQFSIGEILNQETWRKRIDSQRIGVAGHSYGANTVLLLSGAKIDRMNTPLVDPRIKAALIISAPPFHGEGAMQPILGKIKIPNLHITGTEDIIRVPGYRSTLEDRLAVFEATGVQLSLQEQHTAEKRLVVFRGGTHSVFTDRTDRSGPELNATIKKATQELAFTFFETHFRSFSSQTLDQWIEKNGALLVQLPHSKFDTVHHK
jgi:dienelactone hydrolase